MTKTKKWREVIRVLEKNGFKPKKNNGGSHKKYYNEETGRTVIVSAHNLGADVKIGTEKAIYIQAGIKYEQK